jgi:predicted Zn-dependent peptidase
MANSVYAKTVLENGVRVVTESLDCVRSLSIGVIVDCGSKDEGAGEAGLAHLCEHLVFQGTSGRTAIEIAQHADSFGQVGGFTTRDYTCYYAVTLDDYQFHALDLLGDLLLNSTFPEHLVAAEKRAVLGEMERCWDMPERQVHDLAKRSAWRDSSLGRPVIGDAQTVAQHTREDAIYFLQSHYTPDRIIIAAAGHLDHDDFTAQTRDAFWRLLGQRSSTPRQIPAFHPGLTIEHLNSSQAYFCLVIPAPAYTARERYALHVLNRILGGGISSRLSSELREEAGLAYDVHSEYHAYRDAGMMSVEGSASTEQLSQTIAAVLRTVSRLCSGQRPVDIAELWRAKTHLRVHHVASSEDAHTRMCRLGTQELYFGEHLDAREVLGQIEAVQGPAVNAMAQGLYQPLSQAHLVVAGPKLSEPAVRDELIRLMNQFAWQPSSRDWNGPLRTVECEPGEQCYGS